MLTVERLQAIADDLGCVVSLADRALGRLRSETSLIRDDAAGQQELPLAGAPSAAAPAVPATSPTINRILAVVDAIEEAAESNRRQAVLDGCSELRALIDRL